MNVRFSATALSLFLLGSSANFAAAQYQQGPPPPQQQGYGHDNDRGYDRNGGQGGWDAAPQEYNDVRRQGFHEGIEAARQDFQSQQRPRPEQHREFRHPQVPPEARDDFRDAFRKGYYTAMQHMRGGDRDHDHDHDGPR